MSKNPVLLNRTLVLLAIILLFGVNTVSALNTDVESFNIIKYIENPSPDVEKFNPTDDSIIRENLPDRPTGGGLYINIRNHGGADWTYQGLIKFDITSIPEDSIILSAELHCYYLKYKDNSPVGRKFNLYRITSNWNEETVTWNTQPSCAKTPTSYLIMPYFPGVWLKWNVKNDITNFVKGREDNYGWKVSDDKLWYGSDIPLTRFCSKEYGSNISYLEIEFTRTRNNAIDNNMLYWLLERFPMLERLLSLIRLY